MKKNSDKIQEFCAEIRKEIEHWQSIKERGCSDPQYPDGVNMNLTRNHVIYAKRQIRALCVEQGRSYPDEWYLPTPPLVDDNFMASKAGIRYERLSKWPSYNGRLTTKKPTYDGDQCSLI